MYEALLLQQLHWVIQNNDCYECDGHFWWSHSHSQWLERLPYFGNETKVKRTLKSLREQGLIIQENLHWKVLRIRGERTLWYRVNYEKINEISEEEAANAIAKKREVAAKKRQENTSSPVGMSGTGQIDQMGRYQIDQMTKARFDPMLYKNELKELSSNNKNPAEAETGDSRFTDQPKTELTSSPKSEGQPEPEISEKTVNQGNDTSQQSVIQTVTKTAAERIEKRFNQGLVDDDHEDLRLNAEHFYEHNPKSPPSKAIKFLVDGFQMDINSSSRTQLITNSQNRKTVTLVTKNNEQEARIVSSTPIKPRQQKDTQEKITDESWPMGK